MAVRQFAAAGVYTLYCPSIKLGPGGPALMRKHSIRPTDIREGGRFHAVAVEHAGHLKALMRMAGSDNAEVACRRALEMYGPSGFLVKDMVVGR